MVVQLLRACRWHMVKCVEPNLGCTWQKRLRMRRKRQPEEVTTESVVSEND